MAALLRFFELLDHERLRLEDPEAVEATRTEVLLLLFRYLKRVMGGAAGAKMGNGLMIASLSQELYRLHCNMLPV